MKIWAFLGHRVGNADAFSGCARLPPLPADACGVFLGKPESDNAKNISKQLSPSWLHWHLSTICFDFASAVLLVNILLKRPGHGKLGSSPLPAQGVRGHLLLLHKMWEMLTSAKEENQLVFIIGTAGLQRHLSYGSGIPVIELNVQTTTESSPVVSCANPSIASSTTV